MSGTFTYYAIDMMTFNLLGELPLAGVSFSRMLNQSGTFQGSLPVSQLSQSATGAINAVRAGRTLLVVDLDGSIVWTGIIWQPKYQHSKKAIDVQGKEIWSYFERRIQIDYATPPGITGQYWQAQPDTLLNIAKQIVYDKIYDTGSGITGAVIQGSAMATSPQTTLTLTDGTHSTPAPGPLPSGMKLYLCYNTGQVQQVNTTAAVSTGDTTISVTSFTPPVGVTGTSLWLSAQQSSPLAVMQIIPARGWPLQMRIESAIDTAHGSPQTIYGVFPKQQRQTIEALVRQLSEAGVGTGFDFRMECQWAAGKGGPIICLWGLWFPWADQQVGGAVTQPNYGMNGRMVDLDEVIDYEWPIDGFSAANVVYAAGQSSAFIEDIETSSSALSEDYPILETVMPHISIDSLTELTTAAQGDLSALAYPVIAPKITVSALDGEPRLGLINVGDTLRVFQAAHEVADTYFPNGVETSLRVIEIDVTIPDQGEPTMDLTLNIPLVLDPPPSVNLGL